MSAADRETRAAFYERIGRENLAPLWEVIHKLVAREPVTKAVPYLWKYDTVRSYVLESGDLISAREAERRVLVLENPALRGTSQVVDTLYAGLQLILPGEVAPAHRHTPSALRFIVEGHGAYTAVNGEKTYMKPGDFVITPNWAWHDHGHEGDGPMVWLDGLDIPIVHFLGTTFAESYPDDRFPTNTPPGYTLARYGANMKPVDDSYDLPTSPIFSYPYARARESLERMRAREDWDPCLGLKMEYLNPLTGGPAMLTMSTFMQLLPKGFETAAYRATDHAVYSVVEGEGRTIVGSDEGAVTFEWAPRDHFVVPGWYEHRFEAGSDAVLFSYSDRVVQQKLGLWRERRGDG
ncbi:MAG: gentisate 1,2-dioxygenase [Alphaproteobacteria bacterium]